MFKPAVVGNNQLKYNITTSIFIQISRFKLTSTILTHSWRLFGIDYPMLMDQSERSLRIRIDEHRNACKSQDLRSKIFQHSLNLGHRLNFSNPTILHKNCANIVKRLFFFFWRPFLQGFLSLLLTRLFVFHPNMLFLFDF